MTVRKEVLDEGDAPRVKACIEEVLDLLARQFGEMCDDGIDGERAAAMGISIMMGSLAVAHSHHGQFHGIDVPRETINALGKEIQAVMNKYEEKLFAQLQRIDHN